uniref:Uncharacterized protein n=1 Tax=Amphimedon queenslandica TaxID=400682 RepID=A0A1X7V791_AMPQE
MATERNIAHLFNEEIGLQESDYVASVPGDNFCDETSETEYKKVEDMEEVEAEEKEEDVDDIDPPLFDPDGAVELLHLYLEVVTPDTPATSTTPSCDDMRKEEV